MASNHCILVLLNLLLCTLLAVPNDAAPAPTNSPTWSDINTNAVLPPNRGPPSSPSTTSTSSALPARSAGSQIHHRSPAAVEVINNCPFDVGSNLVHAPRPNVEGPPEEEFTWLPAAMEQEGSRLVHEFEHDPNIGVSWKLAPKHGGGPVQFEWTWVPEQRRVYWDLSMIDAETNERHPLIYPSTGPDSYTLRSNTLAITTNSTLLSPRRPNAVPRDIQHSFHPHGITITPTYISQELQSHQKVRGGAVAKNRCGPITCPENEGTCHAGYNVWNDWQAQRDCPDSVELTVVLCGTRDG